MTRARLTLVVALRATAGILFCLFLASCSNYSEGLTVNEFRSDIVVSMDGSAVVNEYLAIGIHARDNYGGVNFHIPLTFQDGNDERRKRSFDLIAAIYQDGQDYYTERRIWDGRTIYVGNEHCKHCARNMPLGKNRFRLIYKLARLVEDRNSSQILRLPGYLGRPKGLEASKTIIFRLPAGGRIIAPKNLSGLYKFSQGSDVGMTISVVAEAGQEKLPDIELEFPAGTFKSTASAPEAIEWWFEDHLLTLLGFLGPLIAALFFGMFYYQLGQGKQNEPFVVDPSLMDRISPGLAAFIQQDKAPSGLYPGFKASVYWLGIANLARIVEGPDEAMVISTRRKPSRKEAAKIFPSVKVMLHHLRSQPKKIESLPLSGSFTELLPAFRMALETEYRKFGKLNLVRPKILLLMACVLFAISIISAYWGGFLNLFLVSLVGFLFSFILIYVAINPQIAKKNENNESDALKNIMLIYFVFPIIVLLCGQYLVSNFPRGGQEIPWFLSCLNLAAVGMCVWWLRRPSMQQRNMRKQISLLQNALRAAPGAPGALAEAMSVKTFERFLPMAVALDAEPQWTESFDAWRTASGLGDYQPAWKRWPAEK